MNSKSLDIVTGALVTRILFENNRATGVEFIRNRNTTRALATSEIIVAGGAINSPQLLMLSGIGPASHLRSHRIPVVCDLPGVGANLQDHLAIGVMYNCTRPITLDGADTKQNLLRYLLGRRGPLTSNIAEAGAFIRSRVDLQIPDIQFLFGPAFFVDHGQTRPKGYGFSIGTVLLRPESRGRIELRSSDPSRAPAIKPNYLTSETDRNGMLAGMRIARQVAHAPAFNPWRGSEYLPGNAADTESALLEYLRNRAETMYHPVGTCRMGSDPSAVVDAELRVHGVDRLRVADASIMPTIIGGNTNAPTFAIAEKAAAMISGAMISGTLSDISTNVARTQRTPQ